MATYEIEYDYEDSDEHYDEIDQVPEPVLAFTTRLKNAIFNQNVSELQNLYENEYAELSDMFFKNSPWPPPQYTTEITFNCNAYDNGDPQQRIFSALYGELYYRHLYAKCHPSTSNRADSYYNYCTLFNEIVSVEDKPYPLQLPYQWMWDIIDEFVYQFQSYSLHKMRANKNQQQSQVDINIWNVHSVLNVLHSLIDKSNVIDQLREYNAGRDPQAVAGVFGSHNIYKMLGYYSMIGLLRLHSLLGDYHQAIKVLENIDLNRQIMRNMSFVRVLACQTATYYYVGFAYMIMKRYSDAIRTFTNMLAYLHRTKQIYQYRTFQVELVDKQTDQMYVLLAMCLVLHPQRVDEGVTVVLREKYGEMMARLQRGDINEFETQFKFSCPKFLSPVPVAQEPDPNADPANPNASIKNDPLRAQLKVFLEEVTQQLPLLIIRSYLKLYKTMSIEKLANFLEVSPDKLEENLWCFKHKKQSIVCQKDSVSPLDGELRSGSDVDFYIDKNMIHIADTKVARRYGDYFLRQVHKFDELYRIVRNIKV
ncbi:Eukaryotic translation initiation factor 3 subunit L, partial [Fragariocoptes setiger]